STGTLTYSAASTVLYNGATTKVDSAVYGNLTVTGTSNKTAPKSFSMVGNLSLLKNLSMGANDTLSMSDTLGTNVTGSGEVDGAVKRTNAMNAGEFYAFNNDSVGLALKHANALGKITMTMTPDTVFGSTPSARYVKRAFQVNDPSAASDTLVSLAMIYTDPELVNVTNVSKLGGKFYNGTTWSKVANNGIAYTRSVDTTSHILYLAGVSTPLSGVTEFGISTTAIQSIASGNWSDSSHVWDDGVIPRSSDDVELYAGNNVANDQTGQSASSITLFNSSTLTVSNGLTVNGVVNVNSSLSTLSVASGKTLTINNLAGGQSFIVNGKIVNNGTIDLIK
ncbi:MAG TPA: hypothetical protein VKS81_05160, partial [Bacteroidota bacterium]|nr:hypothetical protein [Bacteroidota bacterium]